MTKIINIDLDGVLYPWHEVMANWVWTATTGIEWNPYENQIVGHVWEGFDEWPQPYPEPQSWGFEESWGLKKKQFHALFRKGVEAGIVWRAGEPISGAVDGMWQLDENGWYIRVVTKRLIHKFNHATTLKSTAEWLDRWNVPYHEIAVMGQHSSKGMFKADFAVDDNPVHVREYQKAQIECALFDRPWNRKGKFLTRAKGWEAVVELATRSALQDREPTVKVSSSTP